MQNNAHHPHDTLFQQMMDQPGSGDALVRHCQTFDNLERIAPILRDAIVTEIPGSFVDQKNDRLQSDRLYRVDAADGSSSFVYVLVEHKSYTDNRIARQLLGYMLAIWGRECPDGKWLPILPIVVYHGRSPWNQPLALKGFYVGNHRNLTGALDFQYVLAEFRRNWDEYPEHSALRAGLMALAIGAGRMDPKDVPLKMLPGESPVVDEFVYAIYDYLRALERFSEEQVVEVLNKVRPGEAKTYVSKFAQDLVEQGRTKGMVESVLTIVSSRGWTLSDTQKSRILNADADTLQKWIGSVFTALSSEDLFGPTDA